MPEIHKVYYSQKYLYLIKAGSEDLPSIPYEIKSITPGLIMEEITAFLKKETNSHFLHSNDFEHWNISDRFLTLPLAVYDPQLKGTYWNQMFGTERKNYRLEESHSKSLKVQTVYEVPEWLNDFLRQQFNKTSSIPLLGELMAESKHIGWSMNLVIGSSTFIFSVRNDRELFFIDSQGYESVDDILYGILNVLSRQKLALTQAQCNVYAFCPAIMVETLKQGMKRIQELHLVEITERVKPFL
ncbi:MAG: DUF3822 family protein [Flavobacteriia bacterium]|nr:DUF3822 family protein [Flavobacteriia bacterium]